MADTTLGLSPEHQAIWDLGHEVTALTARIEAALEVHEPVRVCVAHNQRHECPTPGGYLYRCYKCAETRPAPCLTWRLLTGKDKPDD